MMMAQGVTPCRMTAGLRRSFVHVLLSSLCVTLCTFALLYTYAPEIGPPRHRRAGAHSGQVINRTERGTLLPEPHLPSLVIHVVRTSHLDPGWLYSFEQYSAGAGKAILTSAVHLALCTGQSGEAAYTLSDTAFTVQWLSVHGTERMATDLSALDASCMRYRAYNAKAGSRRELGRRVEGARALALHAHVNSTGHGPEGVPTWYQAFLWVVDEGLLELTSGGWVQADEALTGTEGGRAQVQLGRRVMDRVLAPLMCRRGYCSSGNASNVAPRTPSDLLLAFSALGVAYQNDVFGHSAGAIDELTRQGYTHIVMNRLPFRDKLGRRAVGVHLGRTVLARAGRDSVPAVGLAALLPPIAMASAGAASLYFKRHCAMQAHHTVHEHIGPPSLAFLHVLHEHYNHPSSHPALVELSCARERGGAEGEEGRVDAWAEALLDAGLDIASSYCSGYPLPSLPGHALVLIGDDFSHAAEGSMACMERRVRAAVQRANEMRGWAGGVQVRMGALMGYLQDAEAQHDAWHSAFIDAARLYAQSESIPRPVLRPSAYMLQEDLWAGAGAPHRDPLYTALSAQGDATPLPTLPGLHNLFPYQDRPHANAWSGYYGTAPSLKVALTHAIHLHTTSLGIADGLLDTLQTGSAPPTLTRAAFSQLCTSHGEPHSDAHITRVAQSCARVHACMHDLMGPACNVHALIDQSVGPSLSLALFTHTEARAGRVLLGLHHDGLTGTSRPHVLRDYMTGAVDGARHAWACMHWAALLAHAPALAPVAPLPSLHFPGPTHLPMHLWEHVVHAQRDGTARHVLLALDTLPASAARVGSLRITVLLSCEGGGGGGGGAAACAWGGSAGGQDAPGLLLQLTVLSYLPTHALLPAPITLTLPALSLLPLTGQTGSSPGRSMEAVFLLPVRGQGEGEEEGPLHGAQLVLADIALVLSHVEGTALPPLPIPPFLSMQALAPSISRRTANGTDVEVNADTGTVHVGGFTLSLRTTAGSTTKGVGGGAYILRMPTLGLAVGAGAVMAAVLTACGLYVAVGKGRAGIPYVTGQCTVVHSTEVEPERSPDACRAVLWLSIVLWCAGAANGVLAGLALASPILVQDSALRGMLGHTGMVYAAASSFACVSALLTCCTCKWRDTGRPTAVLPVLCFTAGSLLACAMLLSGWPDAFVRPLFFSPDHSTGQMNVSLSDPVWMPRSGPTLSVARHARVQLNVRSVHARDWGCTLDLTAESWEGQGLGLVHVTVACAVPSDTELWMRITDERDAGEGAIWEGRDGHPLPITWPGSLGSKEEYSQYGDSTWSARLGTLASLFTEWLHRIPVWERVTLAKSLPLQYLCVHDGSSWVARPPAAPGTDLPFSVYPMLHSASPCAPRGGLGPWMLSADRPGGVAWTQTGRWEGWRYPWASGRRSAQAALVLLGRHTSVDDEKGLGEGATAWADGTGQSGMELLARVRLERRL